MHSAVYVFAKLGVSHAAGPPWNSPHGNLYETTYFLRNSVWIGIPIKSAVVTRK